ncbi:Trans-L-3-hydroxyproline dehydratase [Holothuria leucospilota]|uniref:trans-L-3-hydroxyproline dehydratase n=1 Tax=Holothuria leucospilota TaxID=206669 RepID=A0A9Q1CIE5_HOLLE|nr:Trans-L-3-hydroxyproline dehydratase [Holothuria leucospilota]
MLQVEDSSMEVLTKQAVQIKTIEMHTGGHPVRIIVSGYPPLKGRTILEKRRFVKEKLDHLRKMLMFEPRGHEGMYGALLVEPDDKEAHLGVLFMHNEGYSTMCGHAVISLGRFAIDYGFVPAKEPECEVNIQCPCGLVKATVECKDGKTGDVHFQSVPAFVLQTDLEVQVPQFGKLLVDIAYGGAFYAFIADSDVGIDLNESSPDVIADIAWAVTTAAKKVVRLEHPDSDDLVFLYGTIITDGKDKWNEEPTSNLCVFGDKEIDRSPCGSGVTARVALQYHKGQLAMGQKRVFQNCHTKSQFTGMPVRETTCGRFKGIIVEVSGRGYYTGEATYVIEEEDIMGKGFLVR